MEDAREPRGPGVWGLMVLVCLAGCHDPAPPPPSFRVQTMGPLVLEIPDWPLTSQTPNPIEVTEPGLQGRVVSVYVAAGPGLSLKEILAADLPRGSRPGVPLPAAGTMAQAWEIPLEGGRVSLGYRFPCPQAEAGEAQGEVFLMVEGQRDRAGELVGLMLATASCQKRSLPPPSLTLTASVPSSWRSVTLKAVQAYHSPDGRFTLALGEPLVVPRSGLPSEQDMQRWLGLAIRSMGLEPKADAAVDVREEAKGPGGEATRVVHTTLTRQGKEVSLSLMVWRCPSSPSLASLLALSDSAAKTASFLEKVAPIECIVQDEGGPEVLGSPGEP